MNLLETARIAMRGLRANRLRSALTTLGIVIGVAAVVILAADAPAGQPSYEVTLRVAGPYRYYLATSVQPGASPEAVSGSELLSGSFEPEDQG